MNKIFGRLTIFGIFCLVTGSVAVAQDRGTIRAAAGSQYVISAKAGGVNFISGSVRVDRANSTSGYLVKGDTLSVGDKVYTGFDSKTEILLNPGSYARLGANTEFEFLTTDLDNLRLKLSKGSAIFEVYASNEFIVTVVTPTSRFYLIKSGVYRIDALDNGLSRIEVRKGKAQVGTLEARTLKKARAATVRDGQVTLSKFKRSDRDELEAWSRDRAKNLARANARLKRNSLRSTLWNGYQSRRWDAFNSFGLWTYSPRFGGYCFLPFDWGWRSPYGFGLRRDLYYFRLPRIVYYVPRVIYRPRTNSRAFNSRPVTSKATNSKTTAAPGRTVRAVPRARRTVQPRRSRTFSPRPSVRPRTRRISPTPRRVTSSRAPNSRIRSKGRPLN